MNKTVRMTLHWFMVLNLLLGGSAYASSLPTENYLSCADENSFKKNILERLTNLFSTKTRSACGDEAYITVQFLNYDRTYFESAVFDAEFRESTRQLTRSTPGQEIEENQQPQKLERSHSQISGSAGKSGMPTVPGYQSKGQNN